MNKQILLLSLMLSANAFAAGDKIVCVGPKSGNTYEIDYATKSVSANRANGDLIASGEGFTFKTGTGADFLTVVEPTFNMTLMTITESETGLTGAFFGKAIDEDVAHEERGLVCGNPRAVSAVECRSEFGGKSRTIVSTVSTNPLVLSVQIVTSNGDVLTAAVNVKGALAIPNALTVSGKTKKGNSVDIEIDQSGDGTTADGFTAGEIRYNGVAQDYLKLSCRAK